MICNKNLYVKILLILLVFLLNIGYSQDKKDLKADSQSSEPILIALAAPLTGQASVFGTQIKYGIELAKDEINSKGGIKGRKIEVLYFDDAANP